MIDIDDLPDWCRELILTDATVRFLYDDHRGFMYDEENSTSQMLFYESLAKLLLERTKVRK